MKTWVKVGLAATGLGGLTYGIYYLVTRPAAAPPPPPPPPPPGLANCYGVVTDQETGEPLAGVDVTVDGYEAVTDAEGYFQLSDIEPASYTATFSKEGYETVEAAITLSSGESRELSVAMPLAPTATLYGTVTDAETQAALADVLVTIDGYTSYTDSAGRYEITEIPTGTYSLHFTKEGYEPVELAVTLAPGELKGISYAMRPITAPPPPPSVWKVGDVLYCGVPGDKIIVTITEKHYDQEWEYHLWEFWGTPQAQDQGWFKESELLAIPCRLYVGPGPQATATVIWDGGVVPEFEPGTLHNALVSITNPTAEEWSFTGELWLAGERVRRSDLGTVNPGETAQWQVDDVRMPEVPGTWDVDVKVFLTETNLLIAHIRVDPVVIIEVAPPPPPGELSAADIVKVLTWARCGHYITNPDDSKVDAGMIRRWKPYVMYYYPRVRPLDAMARECGNEVAEQLGLPFANQFYYPGYVTVDAFYAASQQLGGQLNALRLQRIMAIVAAAGLRNVWPPQYPACWVTGIGGGGYDYECLVELLNLHDAIAPYDLQIQNVENQLQSMGDWWKENCWGQSTCTPPELWACRTRKAEEYWDSLSEQEKYDIWMKPAYGECAGALAAMNQRYAYLWAPISPDDLMERIRGLWGGYPEIIDAAQWAIEHLPEYPWLNTLPPGAVGTFTIGIYYVWHYPDDYNPGWLNAIKPGLEIGLNRFSQFMAVNDERRDIVYTALGELQTTADVGHGHGMFIDYEHDQAIKAVNELCHTPAFIEDYPKYDCIFIVFANTHDVFGPPTSDASGTRPSPLYIGDQTFYREEERHTCVIEHELFVVFGVPELHADPGVPTIMWDLELTEIILTEEERQLAKWENYQKGIRGVDFCLDYL